MKPVRSVCDSNMATQRYDRSKGLMVIKPSGVDYDELARKMVVVDLNGNVLGRAEPPRYADSYSPVQEPRASAA